MQDQPVFDANGQITDWRTFFEYDWDDAPSLLCPTRVRYRNEGPYRLIVTADLVVNGNSQNPPLSITVEPGTPLTDTAIPNNIRNRLKGSINPQNGQLDGVELRTSYPA